MKILSLTLFLTACSFGQVVTVAVKIGSAPAQTVTLPPALVASLNAFLTAATKPDPNDATKTLPKYADVADLIMAHLKQTLFPVVVTAHPPAGIAAKVAAVKAAQDDLDATKAAALP